MSHPLRVRGLKRQIKHQQKYIIVSHPLRVRGLKQRDLAMALAYRARRTLCGSGIRNVVRNVTGCLFSPGLMTDISHDFPPTPEQEAASRKAASCSRAQNQNDKAAPAPYVASLPDLPTLALKARLSVARRLAPIASAFSPSKLPIPTPMANRLL